MKKIKLLIASMIGAIALVFAAVLGTKVTAATIVEKNETNTPTAVELDEEYTLSASTVNTGSSVGTSDTTITDAYGIFKFSGAKWGKYSSGTYLCARGNSNAYITVVLNANQKITYSMVAYCTKQSQHTYITLGGVNKVQTDDFSGDNAEKEVTISYTSTTDNNNVQLLFNNKLGFKTLTASVSNAAEEIDYTATFSLSGGSGTKPSDIKVSKTAEDKTITLPSSDGLSKVGHVFGGWNDGTTTYEAGAEYELTSDKAFTAVWNINPTGITTSFKYEFTSASGNGEEIIVEGGSLYDKKFIKLESSTVINFKTSKSMFIVLSFDNNALDKGFKLDDVQMSIDTTTYKYIAKLSAGSHTIKRGTGNDVRMSSLEIVDESVTPLVQKATVDEYTYVRFVTIIKGVEEIDTSDVTFSITMDYTNETTKTVGYTPSVVKKITKSGETYVANVGDVSHTFDNAVNPTEYYVVYVARFTTTKFSGNSVKATTTFGGEDYVSNAVTI